MSVCLKSSRNFLLHAKLTLCIRHHQLPKNVKVGPRLFSMVPALHTKDVPLFLRLVSATTQIASSAGSIARKVVKSGELEIVDKGGGNDPQTIADRAIQAYVVQMLRQNFPKLTVIGEEGDNVSAENALFENLIPPSPANSLLDKLIFPKILELEIPDKLRDIKEEDVVVWLDPLDGTTEFAQGGLGHVTTLIGIAHGGVPVAGVIHEPFSYHSRDGRTIYGIPGVGYEGCQMVLPQTGKRIITTTQSHSNPRIEAAIGILRPYKVIRAGGAGHKALYLVEGVANAYVFASKGLKKWDTCASEALLQAVGGKMTDLSGSSYSYNKDDEYGNDGGLLATAPGEDHDWYVKQFIGGGALIF